MNVRNKQLHDDIEELAKCVNEGINKILSNQKGNTVIEIKRGLAEESCELDLTKRMLINHLEEELTKKINKQILN
ncbi:hypothetical protein ACDJ35_07150 [Enterococcus faecalis]|uniref:hypothetical protein n=1 Tax=Enterococcus TaxID=1350 RepID=UPI00045A0E11|nr:hypothetical protein [Enterococcus faecalis]EGO8528065.1 hypothetical protein [Enterococcus faecalis]EHB4974683.1 hypothetical protein [Enterococcus faecalis]EHK9418918.1 hypothetical protein [Enterococcus faecalis]EHK9420835.1 hypothetical protein [Enterococcus faecalis]EHS2293279.1 hypothetical protein [Enterococcus faecalis]